MKEFRCVIKFCRSENIPHEAFQHSLLMILKILDKRDAIMAIDLSMSMSRELSFAMASEGREFLQRFRFTFFIRSLAFVGDS